jgi:hypothetical protein
MSSRTEGKWGLDRFLGLDMIKGVWACCGPGEPGAHNGHSRGGMVRMRMRVCVRAPRGSQSSELYCRPHGLRKTELFPIPQPLHQKFGSADDLYGVGVYFRTGERSRTRCLMSQSHA